MPPPNVNSTLSNENIIDLYSVGHETTTGTGDEVPFKHTLKLHGTQGKTVAVNALFDGGAMVSAMDAAFFQTIKHGLANWSPSQQHLRMANGVIVPSQAVWKGTIEIQDITVRGEFEVFDSKGGWTFLFGKLLLRRFRASHDYYSDVVTIHSANGTSRLLTNEAYKPRTGSVALPGINLAIKEKMWEKAKGGSSGVNPPSRQVPKTHADKVEERVDQQFGTENLTDEKATKEDKRGESSELKEPIEGEKSGPSKNTGGKGTAPAKEVTITPGIDQLTTDEMNHRISETETLAGVNVVETGSPIFTWHTELFLPERVAQILEEVTLGPDLTDDQCEQVRAVVASFADCFALSMSEVNTVPGACHRLDIPEGAKFRTKIGQRPLNPAQKKYMNSKVDKMIAAGVIAPIHPRDVRNVAATVLAKKAHEGHGLTVDELKHRVNDKCVAHGMPNVFDLPPRPEKGNLSTEKPGAQKWQVCQNFNQLNKVTQVAPMPQGNIRAKQLRLSEHRYIHIFDFAAGFYAIAIHPDSQPYIVFYVEGRGYWKYLRLPFGVTGGPSEFANLTGNTMHDLTAEGIIELFVDNGGSAADTFEEGLSHLSRILERVHGEKLSLSPSKLKLFMTEAIFAGAKVGSNGVSPDPAKLTAIVNWPQPEDASHLEGFLGLVGHFWDLVRGFSKVEKPLRDILRGVQVPKGADKVQSRLRVKARCLTLLA